MFSKGMSSIFITGVTGFIGSNLARAMLDRGHEVTAMIRPESSLWRIQDLKGRMKIYDTGLLDLERLKKAMHDVGPEYIFHLATYGSYPRSQKDSLRMMQTNIIGTYNLLNASLDVPYK